LNESTQAIGHSIEVTSMTGRFRFGSIQQVLLLAAARALFQAM
jgi:hypothetical protein